MSKLFSLLILLLFGNYYFIALCQPKTLDRYVTMPADEVLGQQDSVLRKNRITEEYGTRFNDQLHYDHHLQNAEESHQRQVQVDSAEGEEPATLGTDENKPESGVELPEMEEKEVDGSSEEEEKEKPEEEKEKPEEEKEKPEEEKEKPDEVKPDGDKDKEPEKPEEKPEENIDEPDKEKPEDGKEKPEDGKEKPEDGKEKPEDGKEKPEDGKEKPEDGKEKPEDGKEKPDEEIDEEDDEDIKDNQNKTVIIVLAIIAFICLFGVIVWSVLFVLQRKRNHKNSEKYHPIEGGDADFPDENAEEQELLPNPQKTKPKVATEKRV